MCSLGYHDCAVCGTELKCDVSDMRCVVIAGFEDYCYKCDNENYSRASEAEAEQEAKERAYWEEQLGKYE